MNTASTNGKANRAKRKTLVNLNKGYGKFLYYYYN